MDKTRGGFTFFTSRQPIRADTAEVETEDSMRAARRNNHLLRREYTDLRVSSKKAMKKRANPLNRR